MRRLAFVLAVVPALLVAQEPPTRALPRPVDEHPEGVSNVRSLVELSTDRVLVSDAREGVVRLLSFADGSSAEPATRGRGPREYAGPGGLYRMMNGEVWLLDQVQRRYLVFASNGRPVRTESFAARSNGSFNFSSDADPHLLDGRGREYEKLRGRIEDMTGDSAPLVRRRGERLDTLARLRNMETAQGSGEAARVIAMKRFSPSDGFAVNEEGEIALVRADPYRVEWIGSTGRPRRGAALPFTPVRVTEADLEAARAAARASMPTGVGMPRIVQTGPDGTQRSVDPSTLVPQIPSATEKPSIDPRRLRVDRAGRLWVGRYVAFDAPELYDIFDANGARIDRVTLPAGSKLAGFGVGRIYVTREDEDGLLFIGRIPYAPAPSR
jgi:hypothetical protein